MKRFVVFFMVLLLIGSFAFAGGGGQQSSARTGPHPSLSGPGDWKYRYPETVTVNIGRSTTTSNNWPEGDSWENNAYTRWLGEAYNYQIKYAFMVASADYTRRITLAMASNDIPDIMEVQNHLQLVELMESGMVEDLTGLYDKWASPLLKGVIDSYGGLNAAMGTGFYNNRQYANAGVVYAGSDSNFFIRDDWRVKLGLPIPQTTDDYLNLAEAFVKNDMAGNRTTVGIEIQPPYLGRYGGAYVIDPFFNELGAFPMLWIDDGKGKVTYGSVLPEAKEGLRVMRDMYSRGIIARDYVTRDQPAATAAGQNGIILAAWSASGAVMNTTRNNHPDSNFQVYNWRSAKTGKRHSFNPNVNTQWIVVRKGALHPEMATRLMNNTAEVRSYYDGVLLTPEEEKKFEVYMPVGVREHYYGRNGINHTSWPIAVNVSFNDFIPKLAFNENRNIELFKKGDIEAMTPATKINIENIIKYMDGVDRTSFMPWNSFVRYNTKQYLLQDYGSPNFDVKKAYYPYSTETMQARWANLLDMETIAYDSIIMGQQPLDYFDTFVREWYAQGGTRIIDEVNKQLGK